MRLRSRRHVLRVLPLLGLTTLAATDASTPRWGEDGHLMAGRIAAEDLPTAMPVFFTRGTQRLGYLVYEPDRWRSRELTAMDQAFSYDHYIDLENVPAAALDSPHRFEYLRRLYDAGLEVPERDAGFLPYRILELYQRLLTGWRRWRVADGAERIWIEERILNDAGILGHYVTDAAQPHHTTIHFNGWDSDTPNPRGYTTERDFHGRFESEFVSAHVRPGDVRQRIRDGEPRRLDDVRDAILRHILESHEEVETLYRLEQEARFDPDAAAPRSHVDFTAERLASGASMLRDLWWTAWVRSAEPEASR